MDDRTNIVENPAVQIDRLTPSTVFQTAFSGSLLSLRPLARVSFAINYYFGKLNPFGYHIVNILIHFFCSLAFYFFIKKTLFRAGSEARWGVSVSGTAFYAALLWAVHPIQTQAVTYVVQRMTELTALFSLLTFLCFIQGREQPSRKRVWFSLCALTWLLAMASKETAIVIPPLILLYDIYFYDSSPRIGRKVALFSAGAALTLLGGFLALWLIYGWEQIAQSFAFLFSQDKLMANTTDRFTILERLMTEARVVLYYLSLFVWPNPSRLHLDYLFPISHGLFNPITTFLAILADLGLIAGALMLGRRAPLLSFFVLWYFAGLSVESTFVPLDLVFEHRLYFPSMALAFLLAWGAGLLWAKWTARRTLPRPLALPHLLLLPLFILWGAWTVERNRAWETAETLWQDNLRKAPTFRAYSNLAYHYALEGKMDQAGDLYQKALEIKPDAALTRLNLGNVYYYKKDFSRAMAEYEAAAQFKPTLASAYLGKARILRAEKQDDQALAEIQKALAVRPREPVGRLMRAEIFIQRGDWTHVVEDLQIALEGDPRSALAHYYLGKALMLQKNYPKAADAFKFLLDKPAFRQDAYRSLGEVYQRGGALESALDTYQKALTLFPSDAEFNFQVGNIYLRKGNVQEAIPAFERAASLAPMAPDPRYRLAQIYMQAKRWDDALLPLQQIVAISPKDGNAQYLLAEVFLQKGDRGLALPAAKKAVELNPQSEEAKALFRNLSGKSR